MHVQRTVFIQSICLKSLKTASLKQEPFKLELVQEKYQESIQIISAAFDYEHQMQQAQDPNFLQNIFLVMFQTPALLQIVAIVKTPFFMQQDQLLVRRQGGSQHKASM